MKARRFNQRLFSRFSSIRAALIVLVLHFPFWAESKTVSDELVSNLACESLSQAKIYAAIRDDAFNQRRQILTENFTTRDGLGHCWAIARFQRIALLLGRQSTATQTSPEIIGSLVRGHRTHSALPSLIIRPAYEVFFWKSPMRQKDVFKEEYDGRDLHGGSYYEDLLSSQRRLFFRPSNVQYVYQKPTRRRNLATLKQLMRMVSSKQLPLVNIREELTAQHVVIPVSLKRLDTNTWLFWALDNNFPLKQYPIFARNDSRGIRYFGGHHPDSKAANEIDVFIVSENERGLIEKALVEHYSKLCLTR